MYYANAGSLSYNTWGCWEPKDWWSTSLSTGTICVDITSCLPITVTRDITSYSMYKSGINLVGGYPDIIDYFVNTRLGTAQSIFNQKKTLIYSKVLVTPNKYPTSTIYGGSTPAPANYRPPFSVYAPQSQDITSVNMVPAITYTAMDNSIPNYCYNGSISNTNLYSSTYYDWSQWNHIALQSKNSNH